MSFKLIFKNNKFFKSLVDALSSIIEESLLILNNDKLVIFAMDPSQICVFNVIIYKDSFEEFHYTQDIKIGFNMDDLDKILRRSQSDDKVSVAFDYDRQKITIKIEKEDQSRIRSFSLAVLDNKIKKIDLKGLFSIDFPSNWVVDPFYIVEAVKDGAIYSDVLTIKCAENEDIKFRSSGSIGEMKYDLSDSVLDSCTISGKSSGDFSLPYLKSILKLESITQELKIYLKAKHPLRMDFMLLDGIGDQNGKCPKIHCFLTPRAKEDDY